MIGVLVCLLLQVAELGSEKSCWVYFTDIAPMVDGHIEEVWQSADSASGFIQSLPYENAEPSESTTVYVLQDEENLYVAFRCWAKRIKPINQMTANDDAVVLYLNPFGTNSTAYSFTVYVSGLYSDGLILDDGRFYDDSWDGVWYYAVGNHGDRYEVEIKIPFKSIRYEKGLREWGINFSRFVSANQETDYWTQVSQKEGNLVSRYGRLKGINAQTQGYYFELYPEGFLRSDKVAGERTETKIKGSLNFKWDITPQATLTATTFPDFAQIESDPFTLNLSRYETYLKERRPFFLEGNEIFRMSDFGQSGGFYTPLSIFYSRRIGRSVDREIVPVLAGVKLTGRSGRMRYGLLSAYTDQLENKDAVIEPRKGFVALRASRGVLENSDVGVLLSGATAKSDDYNYALGLDGAYRSGANQFVAQGAFSARKKGAENSSGLAFSYGFMGFVGSFLTISSLHLIEESFDVSDIGYVPWSGQRKFMFTTGPYKTFAGGYLRNLWLAGGGLFIREPDSKSWSKLGMFSLTMNLRNNWGGNLEIDLGPYREAGVDYFCRSGHVSLRGTGSNYDFSMWMGISYTYNYARGFLAYRGLLSERLRWVVIPKLSFQLYSNLWVECDTTNTIIAMWPVMMPRLELNLTPRMSLSAFNEFVFTAPGTDFGRMENLSNRFGFLFSYNFGPKSWLYVALNDYRERRESGHIVLRDRVGAIKAKYLIYF